MKHRVHVFTPRKRLRTKTAAELVFLFKTYNQSKRRKP